MVTLCLRFKALGFLLSQRTPYRYGTLSLLTNTKEDTPPHMTSVTFIFTIIWDRNAKS